MATLLEKAKKIDVQQRCSLYTDEEIELAVGYVNGEVQAGQCREAMGGKPSSVNYLYRLVTALKTGVARGIIKPIQFTAR